MPASQRGLGGRPLQFSFSVASAQLLPAQLPAAFPLPGPQCSVTLARDALQPGADYNVSVVVQNFLGGRDSAQVCVSACWNVHATCSLWPRAKKLSHAGRDCSGWGHTAAWHDTQMCLRPSSTFWGLRCVGMPRSIGHARCPLLTPPPGSGPHARCQCSLRLGTLLPLVAA